MKRTVPRLGYWKKSISSPVPSFLTKARTNLTRTLVITKSGVPTYRKKKTKLTALFATCLKHLSKKDQKLATTQTDDLPFILFLSLFRPKLKRTCFTTWRDHKALLRILTMADATSKLARWDFGLRAFEFDIFHCLETKCQAADALSCL